MKKNFRNILVYVGSLLLPLLFLIPMALRSFTPSRWEMIAAVLFVINALVILFFTVNAKYRKLTIASFLSITLIIVILLVASHLLPYYKVTPTFFIYYYILDAIPITVSIIINWLCQKK